MPDFVPDIPARIPPKVELPVIPKGGDDIDLSVQAAANSLKDYPVWMSGVNTRMNKPVTTRLDQTLRYTDPNIGFNPFDSRLEYKYADAHPWQTLGNNLLQAGARFLASAAESVAVIPLALSGENIYDNEFTNGINDWLESLNNSLPVFRTEYEENHPFLKYLAVWKPESFGGAWGQAVNNLGYTAGAFAGSYLTFLPFAALGNAFKLTKLFGSFGRAYATDATAVANESRALIRAGESLNTDLATTRAAATRALPNSPTATAVPKTGQLGKDYVLAEGDGLASQAIPNAAKNIEAASVNNLDKNLKLLNSIAKVRDWTKYNLSLLTAATAEGTFEANQVMRQGREELVQKFYDDNLRNPNEVELRDINKIVKQSADFTMGANIALLYLNNRLLWGSLFKPGKVAQQEVIDGGFKNISKSVLKRDAATGVYEVSRITPETKLGKLLLNIQKPGVAITTNLGEAFEEGSQFIISEGSVDYMRRKYDAQQRGEVADYMKSFLAGLNKTFNTNEGWDNIIGGFVGGMLGGGVRNRIEKSRGNVTSPLVRLQQQADLMNSYNLTGLFENKVQEAVVNSSLSKEYKKALEAGDVFKANNLKQDMLFNYVSSAVKANRFDMRLEELEAAKHLTPEEFEKLWGIGYTEETGQTAQDYLDTVIEKAKNIKKDIDRVNRLWQSNPFDVKKQPQDHFAYDSYKEELARNLGASREYQARMKNVQEDLKKLIPTIDVQRAIEITSLQGMRDVLKKMQKSMNELNTQIADSQGNEELIKDLEQKRDALKGLFDKLQPQVLDGFDSAKFVNLLEDLYKFYSGLDEVNNEYIEEQKRLPEPNTIYLNAREDKNRSKQELVDALQQLQDIRKLAAANFGTLRYYNYLQTDVGHRSFMDSAKDIIAANLETVVPDDEGKYLTQEEFENQVEEQIRFEKGTPENAEETTSEEREDIRKAAKKKVAGEELTKEEEDLTEKKPNVFTNEVKIQQEVKQKIESRNKETKSAPTQTKRTKQGNETFKGITPNNLFGMFSQDKNDVAYRTNLYNAIFKSGINGVFKALTAKFSRVDINPDSEQVVRIPGTKLYRSTFAENITIYHNGEPIGILRPADSVWLDSEKRRSVYALTEKEYEELTGNDISTYKAFMDSIKAYREQYNKMAVALQKAGEQGFDYNTIKDYFNLVINTGSRVQSNDPTKDTLLKNLNYKPKGSALISFIDVISVNEQGQQVSKKSTEPAIVNEQELTPEQIAKLREFLKQHSGFLTKNVNRYALIVPVNGEYIIGGVIAARNAETLNEQRKDFFDTIKNIAAGVHYEDEALGELIYEFNNIFFLANADRTVKQTFITPTFTIEGEFVLQINNPSLKVYKTIVFSKEQIQALNNYEELMNLLSSTIENESVKDRGFGRLQVVLDTDSLKQQLPKDSSIEKLSELDSKLKLATTPDVFENYDIKFNPIAPNANTGGTDYSIYTKEQLFKQAQEAAKTDITIVTTDANGVNTYVRDFNDDIENNLKDVAAQINGTTFERVVGVYGNTIASIAKYLYPNETFENSTTDRTKKQREAVVKEYEQKRRDLITNYNNSLNAADKRIKEALDKDNTLRTKISKLRAEAKVTPEELKDYSQRLADHRENIKLLKNIEKNKLGVLKKESVRPIYAETIAGIKTIMQDLFGLNEEQADAVAKIYDLNAEAWSKRTGGTKRDFYKQLGFKTELDEAGENILFQFEYTTDKVAREVYDIENLELISKQGSDRDVYSLGEDKVLKVAKTARGLAQNMQEGRADLIEEGLVPKLYERGLNYVVVEKVEPATAKNSKIVDLLNELKEIDDKVSKITDTEEVYSIFEEIAPVLKKYGISENVLNMDSLWGDFRTQRNWGVTKEGKLVHADAGTFAGEDLIWNFLGKEDFENEDFRKIYERSKQIKEQKGISDDLLYQGASPYNEAVRDITNYLKLDFKRIGVNYGGFVSRTKGLLGKRLANRIAEVIKEKGYEDLVGARWDVTHNVIVFNTKTPQGLLFQDQRGAYNTMTHVIYALTNPDVSTPLHELAHSWERLLTDEERQTVLDWAGHANWDVNTSEAFAKGFEQYLAEGNAPNAEVQTVFDKFAKWLLDLYEDFKKAFGIPTLNDAMREVYAKMLNKQEQTITPVQQGINTAVQDFSNNNATLLEQVNKDVPKGIDPDYLRSDLNAAIKDGRFKQGIQLGVIDPEKAKDILNYFNQNLDKYEQSLLEAEQQQADNLTEPQEEKPFEPLTYERNIDYQTGIDGQQHIVVIDNDGNIMTNPLNDIDNTFETEDEAKAFIDEHNSLYGSVTPVSTEPVQIDVYEDEKQEPEEQYVQYTELGETKYAKVIQEDGLITTLESNNQQFDKLTEKLKPATKAEYDAAQTYIPEYKYNKGDKVISDGKTYTITGTYPVQESNEKFYETEEGVAINEKSITRLAPKNKYEKATAVKQKDKNRKAAMVRVFGDMQKLFPDVRMVIDYFDFNAPARFINGTVEVNLNYAHADNSELVTHEVMHPFVAALKLSNKPLYNNLIKDIQQNHKGLIEQVQKTIDENPKLYQAENLLDETLVVFLGREVAKAFTKGGVFEAEGVLREAENLKPEDIELIENEDGTKSLFTKRGELIGVAKTREEANKLLLDYNKQENYVGWKRRELSLLQQFVKWFKDLIDFITGNKKTLTLDEFVENANNNAVNKEKDIRSQIEDFEQLKKLYNNSKHKRVITRFIKTLAEEYNADGFDALVEKYSIEDVAKFSKMIDNILDYTDNKVTGKFRFAKRENQDYGVEFEYMKQDGSVGDENDFDYINVFVDPQTVQDGLSAPSLLRQYSKRITDNDLAEEYENIVNDNFYKKGTSQESIGIKDINPAMNIQTLSDFIVSNLGKNSTFNIRYTGEELNAIDELEAYIALTDPEAAKVRSRIVRKLEALKDTATRRLSSDSLQLHYNVINRLNLDETDIDFVLKYIEQGVVALNQAWRKYNEIVQDINNKETLNKAKLNRLNKELEIVKQLVGFYDDVTGLYNKYEDMFDELSLTRFRKATVSVDRMKASMANTAAELATEWLYPYIESNNKSLREQGYTDEKYFITREEFKNNLLYGVDKDMGYITFQLSALVTSRDPVNAAFANTVSDAIHLNHADINDKIQDYRESYAEWLKATGIGHNNEAAQIDYYKKHYLRKAKVWSVIKYDDATNEPVYGYVEKTALHQEYLYDLIEDDVRKYKESLPIPRTGEEWDKQLEKITEYRKAIKEKYKNPEYEKLKGDKYFKLIEKIYSEQNAKYGKDALQYGIVPQKYRGDSLAKAAKKFITSVKEANIKELPKNANEKLEDALFKIHKDNSDINLDGTVYRNLNKSLSNFKDEDKLELNLQVSIIDFIIDASRYNTLRELQFNAENLRMLIEGNEKFNVKARNIGSEDFVGQIRDRRSFEKAKQKLKELEELKAKGDPAFDEKYYDKVKARVDKGIKPRSVWDKFLPKLKKGQTERLNQQISEWMNQVFYGEEEFQSNLKVGNKVVNLNKFGNAIGYYTSITSMAFNRIAGLANILQGNSQIWIEAAGGKFYNKKDVAWAAAHYHTNITKYMGDLKNPIHSKDTQLALKFDAIQGEFEDEFGLKVSGNIMRRMLRPNSLFFMTKLGEHQIQMQGMLALMHATKVKTKSGETINLYEAYVKDARGRYNLRSDVIFDEEQQSAFKRKLHGINRTLNGNYNELHKGHLQRTWYGKQLLRFRKWLYEGFRARWSGERVDYEKNTVEKGYLNYFFKDYLFNNLINREFNFVKNYNKLTPDQKYRVRKATAEMTLYVTLTMAALGLTGGGGPDKELSESQKAVLLFILRLRGDYGTYHLEAPAEAARMLDNPAASINIVKKIVDVLVQLRNPNEIYDRDYGVNHKGDSKLEAKFKKVIPVLNKAELDWDSYLKYYSLINKDVK